MKKLRSEREIQANTLLRDGVYRSIRDMLGRINAFIPDKKILAELDRDKNLRYHTSHDLYEEVMNLGDGLLDAGISRQASYNLADEVLSGEVSDLTRIYGAWPRRNFYDRNYSETRVPAVPSAIIETLSHQSFPDMRYGQDPNFRFNLARSIYKSVLRHVSKMRHESYTVQPLAPDHFRIEFVGKDKASPASP